MVSFSAGERITPKLTWAFNTQTLPTTIQGRNIISRRDEVIRTIYASEYGILVINGKTVNSLYIGCIQGAGYEWQSSL